MDRSTGCRVKKITAYFRNTHKKTGFLKSESLFAGSFPLKKERARFQHPFATDVADYFCGIFSKILPSFSSSVAAVNGLTT